MADEQASKGFRLPWHGRAASRVRRTEPVPVSDWRETVRSRLVVAAVLCGCGRWRSKRGWSTCRCSSDAEMVARAPTSARTRSRRRRVAATSSIATAACSPTASTPTRSSPTRPRSRSRTSSPPAFAARSTDCDAAERAAIDKNLRRKGQFAYVARKVSPDEEQRVRALEIKGIGFVKESRRFYPKRELLAHVLGYVGLDNVGLGGLESAFDPQIRGKQGRLIIQRDARRRALTSHIEREATAGVALELTIDQYLQNIAERELQAGVAEYGAAGGSIVVMDPIAGEILALANAPTFNPNVYSRSPDRPAPQPRHPGSLRAGIDVQDRDRVSRARRRA